MRRADKLKRTQTSADEKADTFTAVNTQKGFVARYGYT
jgi:hypothetical protein